ncbi:MAG: ribonuclease H-like domain-containing protein [Bacteroidetes bacterium]|nr:ribonuclease H-like domain-containing protein [Bacteroidota bacterium]MBL6942924.1 ribonuclease H-like domain-containing protein [Bacteroidales bacterium]
MNLNLKKPIAIFDIEATGLNVSKDRIVEISVLKISTNGIRESRTWLLNPEYPICEEASKIHGYSNDELIDKPTFKMVAKDINRFFANSDLAGYNALKFDIPMLVEEFLRASVDFDVKKRRLVDVQNIFMKMEQRTLKAAYRFYLDKDLNNAHAAEADTLATLEILESQLDRYINTEYTNKDGEVSIPVRNDIQMLHDFSSHHKNADLIGQLIYNEDGKEVFNFGKHKGKTVEEIFTKDPSYYSWIMNADFPQYTKNLLTNIKLNMK